MAKQTKCCKRPVAVSHAVLSWVKSAAGADIQVHDPLGYSSDHLKRRKTLTRRQPNFARIGDRVQRDEIDFNFLQNWPQTLVARVLPLDGLRDQWLESQYILSSNLGMPR
ncbi:hypothetical protein [Rhodoferax sp.]|uniref:hypothetical protein n=1 Tax=Rhodoferax sp. TaxID=50421 RepID=UPI0027335D1D|nr:hypothetical protein [Rhodoferax sp.]